jgi:cytochrome c oxidase assembly factor CtaG
MLHPLSFLAVLPPLGSRDSYLRTYVAPLPIAVLAVALALYLGAVSRSNRLHPRHPWPAGRTAAFVGGIAVTAIAVCSFLGAYDTTLFWDHMVQHLLLIMVAAALFAVSSPVALLWRATTGAMHRLVTAALRSTTGRVVGHPVTAFVLYAVIVPVTHLTIFFNWAVEYRVLDDVEHFLFVGVGYLFWRQIFGADPNRYRAHPAVRALYLFLAVPVDTFVGLSLDSESHEIFPALAALHRTWGPSLVMDLHVGGVIMWVGGDCLMMLGFIPVIVQWVHLEERRATRADRELELYFPAECPAGQPTAGFALGRYETRAGGAQGGAPAEPVTPGVPGEPGGH